jgi:hypothetical protein
MGAKPSPGNATADLTRVSSSRLCITGARVSALHALATGVRGERSGLPAQGLAPWHRHEHCPRTRLGLIQQCFGTTRYVCQNARRRGARRCTMRAVDGPVTQETTSMRQPEAASNKSTSSGQARRAQSNERRFWMADTEQSTVALNADVKRRVQPRVKKLHTPDCVEEVVLRCPPASSRTRLGPQQCPAEKVRTPTAVACLFNRSRWTARENMPLMPAELDV